MQEDLISENVLGTSRRSRRKRSHDAYKRSPLLDYIFFLFFFSFFSENFSCYGGSFTGVARPRLTGGCEVGRNSSVGDKGIRVKQLETAMQTRRQRIPENKRKGRVYVARVAPADRPFRERLQWPSHVSRSRVFFFFLSSSFSLSFCSLANGGGGGLLARVSFVLQIESSRSNELKFSTGSAKESFSGNCTKLDENFPRPRSFVSGEKNVEF